MKQAKPMRPMTMGLDQSTESIPAPSLYRYGPAPSKSEPHPRVLSLSTDEAEEIASALNSGTAVSRPPPRPMTMGPDQSTESSPSASRRYSYIYNSKAPKPRSSRQSITLAAIQAASGSTPSSGSTSSGSNRASSTANAASSSPGSNRASSTASNRGSITNSISSNSSIHSTENSNRESLVMRFDPETGEALVPETVEIVDPIPVFYADFDPFTGDKLEETDELPKRFDPNTGVEFRLSLMCNSPSRLSEASAVRTTLYDGVTGEVLDSFGELPVRFDPETGEDLSSNAPPMLFDPLTGESITEYNPAESNTSICTDEKFTFGTRFHPMTGAPIPKFDPVDGSQNW